MTLDTNQRTTVIEWHVSVSLPLPPIFGYLIFAPALSLLSIAYLELAPRLAPQMSHPFALLAVEATNTVSYFVGFIVLAVYLSQKVYCSGSVCAVARAMSVVAAVEFSSWIATTILLTKDFFKKELRRTTARDFDVVPHGCRGPHQQLQRHSDSEATVYGYQEQQHQQHQQHSPQMRQAV